MKKKIIYVVILLLFNITFIGKANADSCINLYSNIWQNQTSFTISSNPGYISKNIKFQGEIPLDMTYDYIKIPFYVVSVSTGNIISNINLYKSCVTETNVNDRYTITYNDGTTAVIDAEEKRTICEQYNINGNAILPYEPYINFTNVALLFGEYGYMQCELDNNLIATCRIPKNENNIAINGYSMNIGLNNNSSTIKVGFTTGVYNLCRDSGEQIRVDVNSIKNKLDQNNQTQQESNKKIDEIKESDISSESKESPNTKEFNDYQDAEKGLFEKMETADTSKLNVAIDGNSANFVWDTITRFYNSNALIMNLLISILSIGIIKMALGR